MPEEFKYDLTARRNRISDEDLITSLQNAAEAFGGNYFSTTQYDSLSGKKPHSATIIDRFGSWKKSLKIIGIEGGREKRYSPVELIENLEKIWKDFGYPPGKRQIRKFGLKISETPYKKLWGSVRAACECVAAFHEGRISRELLLAGKISEPRRTPIPLNVRWTVLKRDNYRCVKCGESPSNDHQVMLEVDHILSVARGGGNDIENLQTLCQRCNQGKKDK
jgi:hypothetical protein